MTMSKTREEIAQDILQLLQELADDWEYSGEITPQTRLFTDMGLTSLDVVVLGTAIQERYGQTFPFLEFYAEIGQRDVQDIPIGEWVEFIYKHLAVGAADTRS
jgi:acyl carrier protein